jgi:hypothetical protein
MQQQQNPCSCTVLALATGAWPPHPPSRQPHRSITSAADAYEENVRSFGMLQMLSQDAYWNTINDRAME